jgi:hypothetical protein
MLNAPMKILTVCCVIISCLIEASREVPLLFSMVSCPCWLSPISQLFKCCYAMTCNNGRSIRSQCLKIASTLDWSVWLQTLSRFSTKDLFFLRVRVTLRLTVSQSVSQYVLVSSPQSRGHIRTDGQSVSMSRYPAHCFDSTNIVSAWTQQKTPFLC